MRRRANFSRSNTEARLLPLRDVNGGVPGFPLDFNSPAINAGNNATCPAVDLRGAPRPIDLRCEIGALEFDYLAGAYGEVFVVNTLADTDDASCDPLGQGIGNQDCSLREAIFLSNLFSDTNTISFSVSGRITLGALLPEITGTLEIVGSGRAITISGARAIQVLSVLPGSANQNARANRVGIICKKGFSRFSRAAHRRRRIIFCSKPRLNPLAQSPRGVPPNA